MVLLYSVFGTFPHNQLIRLEVVQALERLGKEQGAYKASCKEKSAAMRIGAISHVNREGS